MGWLLMLKKLVGKFSKIAFVPAVFIFPVIFLQPDTERIILGILHYFLVVGLLLTQPDVKYIASASKLAAKPSSDRYTFIYLFVYAFLAILAPYYATMLKDAKISILSIESVLGFILGLFGLLFRFYSLKHLGKWFSAEVIIEENHELVKSGPYGYLRHPSYTGVLLYYSSIPLMMSLSFAWVLGAFVFSTFVYILRIRVEEKLMVRHFGVEYENYKKSTWALIPYIY
ncbi:MAG: isoprenylcysteine carboxylmethyltransferase family protein [Bdellovibrionales bacterium]|nr:isoprenylcysteine carboxylmethyltransferase family protein [Bdellovibrionales bacterium]